MLRWDIGLSAVPLNVEDNPPRRAPGGSCAPCAVYAGGRQVFGSFNRPGIELGKGGFEVGGLKSDLI
jgi:hypothetical protein